MTSQDILLKQSQLVRHLANILEQEGSPVHLHETHISLVIVAEKYTYKFKKAVRFDFLDFSTLDARHFYCEEELRLNRRLAPDLYLGVEVITGDHEHPVIGGAGFPIEYAVKMRTFSQEALWTNRIKVGRLNVTEIDALARMVAEFHINAAVAPKNSVWGATDSLRKTAVDNLAEIADMKSSTKQKDLVRDIMSWQEVQLQKLSGIFENRKASGMVRECHGDLHCGNILTIDDRVEVFDCIEFSENLRWIDVMDDIAFVYMDLRMQRKDEMAARLLNQYLEITGDYEGLPVLRYYQVHRATVRCKVAMLRACQLHANSPDSISLNGQAEQYLAFAAENIRPVPTAIMITHGYSGCGKSTLSKLLVELLGAIQIRSDVERKRMQGIAPTSRPASHFGTNIYDPASTKMTYDRLCVLARYAVESGMSVIVDAAFLRTEQRGLFQRLAAQLDVPFFIFDVHASEATMRDRITLRAQLNQDPSDAGHDALAHQIAEHDPLSEDEMKHVIAVNSEMVLDMEAIQQMTVPLVRQRQNAFMHHLS